jgi:hypothetical protein
MTSFLEREGAERDVDSYAVRRREQQDAMAARELPRIRQARRVGGEQSVDKASFTAIPGKHVEIDGESDARFAPRRDPSFGQLRKPRLHLD